MAKQTGLGDSLLIDGYDLSGDIGSVQTIKSEAKPLEVTAINVSAIERILGHHDGMMEFNAFFNDAASKEHVVLKAKNSGSNRVCSYLHGATLGNWAAGIVAKQINYDPTRGADGSLTEGVLMNGAAYGLDHCDQLTAGLRTDTGATNGPAVDNWKAAATTLGLSAYLQVTAFSGTDVTVKIQDSADGSTDWQDVVGGGFTQIVSGPTSERIRTASGLTVRRYLRVVTVTTGGVTSVTFSVIACRFPVA